ncbi:flagellar hook assembly protein FlgD [Thalassotalea mangrovi]|uniref:FlgD/Vpr Ig-like domain-containing protein n=1 Tax=Thalassotalea mangrovi TaxID=2572245 RepID=A0A4V5NU76_9GAMM|nr:FlgD immunoglobulin-like domain containing protein [Thalassotalea mangrovi]TKB45155.1 hypothetical protein E8M12_10035 [Thalassotalea mangrovi]
MARIEPSLISTITRVERISDLLARILPTPKVVVESDPLDVKSDVAQMLADTGGRVSGMQTSELKGDGHAMSGFSSSNAALQASALVGRYLLIEDAQVEIEQAEEVQGHIDLPRPGKQTLVYVQDSKADVVKMIPLGNLPQGPAFFRWQGDDRHGNAVQPGMYRFLASAVSGFEMKSLPVSTFQKIVRINVHPKNQSLQLVLENGTHVAYSPNLLIRDELI